MAKLNLTQAAKAAGITRQTLYAHLEKGKVSYSLDRNNNKEIDSQELVRVYGELKSLDTAKQTPKHTDIDRVKLAVIEAEKTALQRENELLREQLRDTKDRLERTEEREQRHLETIERLRITHQPQPVPPATPVPSEATTETDKRENKSFWKKIFGG